MSFQRVIDSSDVVVHVIDARDPLGTISESVVRASRAAGKRLVLCLNKTDLIPNQSEWLKVLRRDAYCVVPFAASTLKQRRNLFGARGTQQLMSAIRGTTRDHNVIVGVVGYESVGKSSVINSLKRHRACATGARHGTTRHDQSVAIDRRVRIIDTPGLVADDARTPLERIVQCATVGRLAQHYRIDDADPSDDIDRFVHRLRQRMGARDAHTVEQRIVADWNSGRIRHYTVPHDTRPQPTIVDAQQQPTFDVNKDEIRVVVQDEDAVVMTTPSSTTEVRIRRKRKRSEQPEPAETTSVKRMYNRKFHN